MKFTKAHHPDAIVNIMLCSFWSYQQPVRRHISIRLRMKQPVSLIPEEHRGWQLETDGLRWRLQLEARTSKWVKFSLPGLDLRFPVMHPESLSPGGVFIAGTWGYAQRTHVTWHTLRRGLGADKGGTAGFQGAVCWLRLVGMAGGRAASVSWA